MTETSSSVPRYVRVAPNSCLRVVDGDRWVGSVTLRVGDHHVAVRAGSPEVHRALKSLLARHLVDDPDAPASFGIQVTRAALPTARPLYHVYAGCSPILVSRSCERAVAMVAGHLERLLPSEGSKSETLTLAVHAIVSDQQALLVPRRLPHRVPTAELRLARRGLRQVETTFVDVDPLRRTVCVGSPRLLDGSEGWVHGRLDGPTPTTRPGQRRIIGWVFPGRDGPLTRAYAVARAVETLHGGPAGAAGFRSLARVVEGLDVLTSASPESALQLAEQLLVADPQGSP